MKNVVVEISRQEELRRAKEAAKAARRQIHEQRRLANEAARASHRENCLEGMRQAGQLENEGDEDDENPPQEEEDEDEGVHQVSDDEEGELVEQKSLEKAAVSEGRISKRKNKKKKTGKKIAKKHPAYNYLTQKAESKLI